MASIRTNLRAEVIANDPDWPVTSRIIEEYRFSSPDGKDRVFKADYQNRGIYGE